MVGKTRPQGRRKEVVCESILPRIRPIKREVVFLVLSVRVGPHSRVQAGTESDATTKPIHLAAVESYQCIGQRIVNPTRWHIRRVAQGLTIGTEGRANSAGKRAEDIIERVVSREDDHYVLNASRRQRSGRYRHEHPHSNESKKNQTFLHPVAPFPFTLTQL